MFTKVRLENYKSLIDFEVDLTEKKDSPRKVMLIYGENGIGKSNFASSFLTLSNTLMTRSHKVQIDNFLAKISNDNWDDLEEKMEVLKNISREFEIEEIIKSAKTNDSEGNMLLQFNFRCKNKNGFYQFITDNKRIISEKLEYVYNKNQVEFFSIENNKVYLNSNVFKNVEYIKEINTLISKYWGKHSLLSIIVHEMKEKNIKYIRSQLGKELIHILDYFMTCSIRINESSRRKGVLATKHEFFQELNAGKISVLKKEKLVIAETFLNDFFTGLYSDIKKVYYRKKVEKKEIEYELRIKKQIYGKLIDVSFSQESTGTRNILELLPFIIEAIQGNTVIIDEIDSGIHDLLMCFLMKYLQKSLSGQVIVTTHNTMLLDSEIDKKSMFVFVSDHEGNKSLIPITDFEGRIHPNLNIRKRYIEGLYGGVPMEPYVEFDELVSELE